jgi:uncharacterized membrane protein YbhN (UPF0104 family)
LLATIAIVCLAVALGAAFGALYPFASTAVRRIIPANWRGPLSRHRALSWTADTDEVLSRLFADLTLSAGFSAVTASVYLLTALQAVLALRAVGADVSLAEAWIAFAAATLTGLLVLLPAGLGAWDATMPAVLNSQGVDLLDATASTLLLRAIQTLPLGLLSIACYLALARQRGGDQQTATGSPDRPVGAD